MLVSSAIKIADPWDKAPVLRQGHFHSLRGPGLFFVSPSSAIETMGLGSMAGPTALTMGIGQDKAKKVNGTIAGAPAE